MNAIIPRPYQNRTVNAWFDYYEDGNKGHTLFGLPTGSGKSIIPSLIIKRCMDMAPFSRFLIATHVKELIAQNASAARLAWPLMPMGICSAGLNKWEPWAPVVFGGIASMVNKAHEIGHRDVMFIDEAHLVSLDPNSMYRRFIVELLKINPKMKICGLSATLFRMGQGTLVTGDDALFNDVVLDLTTGKEFLYFLDQLYLAHLKPKPVETIVNVDDVRVMADDFNQKHIAREASKVTRAAVEESITYGRDRKKWMVFGAGIKNCYQIQELLTAVGVSSVVVHSDNKEYRITDDERDGRIKAFKQGMVQAIISNNILLTGFDCPGVDLIVDLRPTTSINCHIQKYGRGTRQCFHRAWTHEQLRDIEERRKAMLAGDKPDGCMILDFAGNRDRLGAINAPKVPTPKGSGGGETPFKVCPNCGASLHPTVRFCDFCGHEFIFKIKIKKSSQNKDLIEYDTKIELLKVKNWGCVVHRKAGKTSSLKVTYWCGPDGRRPMTVYLGFSSTKGYPKKIAHDWWRQHFGDELIPSSSEEAYEYFNKCRMPSTLKVDTAGKFPDITEYQF